jgi:hypothetical protein
MYTCLLVYLSLEDKGFKILINSTCNTNCICYTLHNGSSNYMAEIMFQCTLSFVRSQKRFFITWQKHTISWYNNIDFGLNCRTECKHILDTRVIFKHFKLGIILFEITQMTICIVHWNILSETILYLGETLWHCITYTMS